MSTAARVALKINHALRDAQNVCALTKVGTVFELFGRRRSRLNNEFFYVSIWTATFSDYHTRSHIAMHKKRSIDKIIKSHFVLILDQSSLESLK